MRHRHRSAQGGADLNAQRRRPISMAMAGGQQIDRRARWSRPCRAGGSTARSPRRVPTLSRERLKALIRSGALDGRRQAGPRSRRPRCAATSASRSPFPSPSRRITRRRTSRSTIVFEDEHLLVIDKPAGPGRPPRRGQSRRDAGQRLAPPLRRPACRASAESRGRASSTASTRTRRGCWWSPRPTSRTKGWPSSSRRTASTAATSRSSAGVPEAAGGHGRRPARPLVAPTARRSRSSRKAAASAPSPTGSGSKPLRDAALVECRLETGRTHQVRVHMASIGHPLLGDPVYGGAAKTHREATERIGFQPPGAARGRARVHPPGNEAPFVVRKRHSVRHAGTVQRAWCIGYQTARARTKRARRQGE